MLKAVCLDTRILSQYLAGKEQAKKIITDYLQMNYEIYTSTVNISEFFYGAYKTNHISEDTISQLELFFANLHPRVVDYEVARIAGKLNATQLRGQPIGWRDTYIAAIVLLNGKKIITSNPEHFKRIKEIQIIEYH